MAMTIKQIPRKFGITTAVLLLLATSIIMLDQTHNANALGHSSNVAYVTDSSCGLFFGGSGGVEDSHSPTTTGPGCSIFSNAVTGSPLPNGGTYTTSGGNAVTFTDVPAASVTGVASFSGYDTVMVYEVCDIASHPALISALNTYLSSGMGKVVIYDGDLCAPGDGGTPDYSTFLFPFASSNPGPAGATGSITSVESESPPATLTRSISTGLVAPTDAVGDSNTFTSFTGGWCSALQGTNALGTNGIQVGYARTSNGGLAIYDGNDNWFTFAANPYDKQVFDNILDQPFNPDSLPCGIPVTGIKLDPSTATNNVGVTHTVTATVTDSSGNPQAGITVTFKVSSGPNTGTTGTAVTNSSGQATFSYTGTVVGTDTIVATFTDKTGGTHTSNTVTKIWVKPNPPPVDSNQAVTAIGSTPVPITLVGTDTDGDTLTYSIVSPPTNGILGPLNTATGTVTYAANSGYFGPDSFTFKTNDGHSDGNVATVSITVKGVPDCSKATPSQAIIWPPNHKMVPITINGVTDPDGDVTTITITSIFQDEPVSGDGSGHTAPDGSGVGTSTADVRAERDGPADGRTYTIAFSADDGNGGTCTGNVLVEVPHDQSTNHPEINQGPLYDSTKP